MTVWTAPSGDYADDANEFENLGHFERISHRQQGAARSDRTTRGRKR